jgi:type VI secretion system (T6SS) baseplate-like injector VgrG
MSSSTSPNPNATSYKKTAGPAPVRQWLGVYQAVVVNNHDPMQQARVICQVPQVSGTAYTTWCVPLIPPVNPLGPVVKTQIHVMFTGGDPDYPVYLESSSIQTFAVNELPTVGSAYGAYPVQKPVTWPIPPGSNLGEVIADCNSLYAQLLEAGIFINPPTIPPPTT